MHIRPATEADLPALLDLHNMAVRDIDWMWIEKEETLADRKAWFAARQRDGFPVVVAVDAAGKVLGYAGFGAFRGRDGYDLTVEHSVYLFPEARGQGTGKALLTHVIDLARQQGRHAMVAVIDAQNTLSIRMHERFGFIRGGMMPQIGKKRGKWRDQVTMYLLLDDRPAPPA